MISNRNKIEYSEEELYETLKKYFPKQNDDYHSDYKEELNELRIFGVLTIKDLETMIKKHIDCVLKFDRSPLTKKERVSAITQYGEDFVLKREKAGFWFSFPALLRNLMEKEFGEEYVKFNTYIE